MEKEFQVNITIDDFAKILGTKVITTPIMNNKKVSKFTVSMDGVELLDDGFLISLTGIGETVFEAEKNWFEQISGKNLQVHSNTLEMPVFKL